MGLTKEAVRTEITSRHRQRRDLRRTGMVGMAEAGATTPQIAGVSGHSIDTCQKILDTYLPRRSDIALGAIRAWENKPTPAARANSSTQSVVQTVLQTANLKAKSV